MKHPTILVVDDDKAIRTLLRNCFEGEGFTVLEADDAQHVLDIASKTQLDLITLDLQLGGDDGFEIARTLRRDSQVPIIMVTGKEDVIDRVVGLEIGADDYVTKPFHIRELLARVRTVLRRSKDQTPQAADPVPKPATGKNRLAVIRFDGLIARPEAFDLRDRDGNPCELTSGDFKLLKVFLDNPKRILSRERLMDLVSGTEWAPLDRTIDNQVARLRKKIERDPADPKLIKTVRGIGYVLACDLEYLDSFTCDNNL